MVKNNLSLRVKKKKKTIYNGENTKSSNGIIYRKKKIIIIEEYLWIKNTCKAIDKILYVISRLLQDSVCVKYQLLIHLSLISIIKWLGILIETKIRRFVFFLYFFFFKQSRQASS